MGVWAEQPAQYISARDQQGRKQMYLYIREAKSLLSFLIYILWEGFWSKTLATACRYPAAYMANLTHIWDTVHSVGSYENWDVQLTFDSFINAFRFKT